MKKNTKNRNFNLYQKYQFATLNGFLHNGLVRLSSRRKNLEELLASGKLNKFIKHAGKYAGRRPSLHIETGLLLRVRHAKLGKYVRQFPKFESAQFEEQLLKAERLMTADVSFQGNRRLLIQATQRVISACKFPNFKFTPTSYRYAAENQINKQSSSGFPRYRRKGLVLQELIRQAEKLTPTSPMWNWPMTRGFRIQLRKDKNNVVPKIRVMYPYPGVFILLEDSFIIPFVQHFISQDTFYIIGKNGGDISRVLKDRLANSTRILSSDVSSFDQNMLNEVIYCAFGILRQQLKLTKLQAELFESMVDYFCCSLMVSKTHGTP